MARDHGLADRLRARGLKVVEVDGWKDRGDDVFHPTGCVNHHTAGPIHGNAPSLAICINGRSDLPGPLCHVLKARDQTCYVIAAGRANHAGKGGWSGQQGNSSVYGLECENAGTKDDPWSSDDIATMVKVHAAFLDGTIRKDPNKVCQHWEWTTRKIDAHDINGATFRSLVANELAQGTTPPPPDPTDTQELDMDDEHFKQLVKDVIDGEGADGKNIVDQVTAKVEEQARQTLAGVKMLLAEPSKDIDDILTELRSKG